MDRRTILGFWKRIQRIRPKKSVPNTCIGERILETYPFNPFPESVDSGLAHVVMAVRVRVGVIIPSAKGGMPGN